jgi:hypothetical protein
MIDRMKQRADFATAQTNKDMQAAMSQYQSWAKQNPQSATPQPSSMSAYTPKVGDMKPAAMGGVNTAYTQAWNAYAPPVNTTRKVASVDPVRGIPSRTTQTYRTTEAKSYGGEGQGNLSYMPNDKRPAGFEAKYTDFDGALRDAPVTNQRDALIERINATAQPYYANSGVGTNDMGRQQFDMPRLMRESKDMAANGYTNPLLQGLFAR